MQLKYWLLAIIERAIGINSTATPEMDSNGLTSLHYVTAASEVVARQSAPSGSRKIYSPLPSTAIETGDPSCQPARVV
ncbi:hypothetical protein HD806DRAFT_221302 [Xylariaceae sp. AK1471]|nr:hypothetical protein HD806DRAFT_221302 [Xylariaceae sp. AK1471]